jgi:hypothetical protein
MKVHATVQACAKSENMPGIDRPSVLAVCLSSAISVLVGWALIQGPVIDWTTFFIPWHHDDFDSLSAYRGFQPWAVRPVSTNVLLHAGHVGPHFLYVTIVTIWTVALSLTSALVLRVFRLQPNLWICALLAFVGSCILFSLPASVQTVQYSGLITNALSYLFGISAAHVIIATTDRRPRFDDYATIGFFCFLSAFAKEDMAVFLAAVCLYASADAYAKGEPFKSATRRFVTLSLIIGACYGLSIAHSLVVHSPFVSGTGFYDISNVSRNVVVNVKFYANLSPGTRIVICGFALVAVAAVLASRWDERLCRPAAAAAWIALAGAALLGPYLILPRAFEYYAMSFLPLAAFSLAPAVLALCKSRGWSEWASVMPALAIAAGAAIAAFVADRSHRDAGMAWVTNERSISNMEINELHRVAGFGLRECEVVKVTGVSSGFGPFLASSANYLDQELKRNLSWEVAFEPGTRLEGFAIALIAGLIPESGRATGSRWRYIAQRDIDLAPRHGQCWLDFQPSSLRATLHREAATSPHDFDSAQDALIPVDLHRATSVRRQ